MSDPSLSMAATRSLPSRPVKNGSKNYAPSVTQSANYHHRRHMSNDMEDDEACSDLYVNQRDLQEAVRLRQMRRHR